MMSSLVGYGQDHRDDQQAALSWMTAYVSNLAAVDEFEVAWRYESQTSSDSGAIEESLTTGRMAVVAPGDRYFAAMDQAIVRVAAKADGAVDQKSISFIAVLGDGETGWTRVMPGKPNKARLKEPKQLLKLASIPYLGAIGLVGFPLYHEQAEQMERQLEWLRGGGAPLKVTSAGSAKQVVQLSLPLPSGGEIRRTTAFDVDTMVPINFQERWADEEKILTTVTEHYVFSDISGIFVPTEITGERRRKMTVDEKRVPATELYQVRFVWKSLNKGISPELLNPEILSNDQLLRELVSPSEFGN